MSIVGSLVSAGANLLGIGSSRKAAEQNVKAQREFAQKGIQWKVADAEKAGLHPLFALGAQTHSFSPSYTGDSASFASMGQDLSRAVNSVMTREERATQAEQQRTIAGLNVERMQLENELLRAQIAQTQRDQVGPPAPSATSYPVRDGAYELKAAEIPAARLDDPSTLAGPPGPAFTEVDLGWMGKWKVPGDVLAQGTEDLEPVKLAAIIGANEDKIPSVLKNFPPVLIVRWLTRPDWVRELEKREGFMVPLFKDGKPYYTPLKELTRYGASGLSGLVDQVRRYGTPAYKR